MCTLQLKKFEPCSNVNIFQVFLRKSEKSIISGLIRASKKSMGSQLFGTKKNFLASAVAVLDTRLFVHRKREKLFGKNAANFAAREQ